MEPTIDRIVILEEPTPFVRFRYECEGRAGGPITGVNSTTDNKTYPTIKVNGLRGRAKVLVSCVAKDSPHW